MYYSLLQAPATKKRHACIDTLPKYCACHAKHENDLTFCDLGAPKRAFRARLPPLFILWKTGWCRSACVPPNREKLTSWRRRRDDDTTTRRRRGDDDTTTRRRRHDERNANTGPTPDPNYKREPFATHSGKNCLMFTPKIGEDFQFDTYFSDGLVQHSNLKLVFQCFFSHPNLRAFFLRPSTLSSKLVKLTRHPSRHSAAGGGIAAFHRCFWWWKQKHQPKNHRILKEGWVVVIPLIFPKVP